MFRYSPKMTDTSEVYDENATCIPWRRLWQMSFGWFRSWSRSFAKQENPPESAGPAAQRSPLYDNHPSRVASVPLSSLSGWKLKSIYYKTAPLSLVNRRFTVSNNQANIKLDLDYPEFAKLEGGRLLQEEVAYQQAVF